MKIIKLTLLLLLMTITGSNISLSQISKGTYSNSGVSNNSSIYKVEIPAALKQGEQKAIILGLKNTGQNIWTKGNYYLVTYDNTSNVWDNKTIPLPHDVIPGQDVDMLFNITAPMNPGTYSCNWVMTDGINMFGEYNMNAITVGGGTGTAPVTVTTVPPGDNNSEYVNQTIPLSMVAGNDYKLSVSMKNTGTTTWVSGMNNGYRLQLASNPDNSSWSSTPVYLSQSIEPGQTATIDFTMRAPLTVGTYSMQWMMNNGVSYFGQAAPTVLVTVTEGTVTKTPPVVSAEDYNSSFMDQTVPDQMTAGVEYDIAVTMTNTGKKTWVVGDDKLVLVDARSIPMSLNSWNAGYVQLPENVQPGSMVTIRFKVKPEETGWQHFQTMMMNSQGTVFGTPSKSIEVLVNRTGK